MGKEIRILIVEDEFMISEDIAMRLTDFGYVIEGVADCAEKALEILANGRTDLALLDINIKGDMDGIELAAKINAKYNIPFIFLTSFANKAVVERANKTTPSAYLLKPFNDRQVQIAIDMALYSFSNRNLPIETEEKQEDEWVETSLLAYDDGLFLKKDSHFEKIEYSKILYFQADGSYTTIYTATEKFVFSYGLKSIEQKLPPNQFKRIHRSFVVNLNAITGFDGLVLFLGKTKLSIGKSYRTELLRRLSMR
jgi:DNA-binding LytR/AlgR family response regulator